ncbi:CDP-alcohol phosphatidyltransferase [Terrabacter sp. 2RAF25]|uniref:CDP-alcohol phosphatidyltransferase n=1 Tax=Terrabacter sp. 2RAF25 TaxID=3232998 RepID=UPI003F9ACF59
MTATTRPARTRTRPVVGHVATAVALVVLWVALLAPVPAIGWYPTPLALLRVPLEGVVLVAALLVLRGRVRRWLAVVVGVLLGALFALRVLDAVFVAALYRPFNALTDWRYVGSAHDLVGDAVGPTVALLVVAGAVLLLLGLVAVAPWAVLRVGSLVERHRSAAWRVALAGAVAWLVCAPLGLSVGPDLPVASATTAALTAHEVTTVRDASEDRASFATQIPVDAFADARPDRLLTALRGKDVVVVFVESYGRVAVERSPDVATALAKGTSSLQADGWSTRSAWLTSPTFGGISWLAHSTLQSGLWVSSQQRYDQLLETRRLTLARAFSEAGWRTVDVIPADWRDWPEGRAFYGYDHIYDARTLGYAGPGYGYAPMPDQYTLSAFDRLELARPDRPRIMAEVDLVTSHVPWAPLPRLVDWSAVGDGSVFLADAGKAPTRDVVWRSTDRIKTAYGQTVAYSLDSVVSFLEGTKDDNLVVLVLGDHQPVSVVSGENASHDVPVSLVTRDKAVLERIRSWGWQDGLRPAANAPTWPMDRFRDRFLTAYGPGHDG